MTGDDVRVRSAAPPDVVRGAHDAVARAVARLRTGGQRVTPPRRAVVEVLAAADEHLTADDVSARIDAVLPGVNRATVYRTLETLADLGVVTHVHVGHGATVHHLAGEAVGEDHLHAHCRRCGRVVDVPGDLLDAVRGRLVQELGFHLEPQHVALSGTCAVCSPSRAHRVPSGET
ncbi:Fur family transcriptional regulator [Pseudokineococcus basanitobsidens]|uniref:Fur family transcriptional regulator n=1 Tax=Pseudokineococcus basanitobsidens TaxID=1926649 RepID=A0ABU8RGJ2_9ACTN